MAVSGTSAPCRSSAAAAFSMAGRRLPACPSARRGAGRGRGGGNRGSSAPSSPLLYAEPPAGPARRAARGAGSGAGASRRSPMAAAGAAGQVEEDGPQRQRRRPT